MLRHEIEEADRPFAADDRLIFARPELRLASLSSASTQLALALTPVDGCDFCAVSRLRVFGLTESMCPQPCS